MQLLEQDEHRFDKMMFSDESHFHLFGDVNHQNFRYWSDTNPHWYKEEPLHSPRVTVWAAIGRLGIVGPVFIEGNVNAATYLHVLQEQFLPWAQQSQDFDEMIFQEDGAPVHAWNRNVRNWLNTNLEGRWMGRMSPNMPWPPYSPDLTPCDFFLWGHIKSQVYHTQPADLEELKQRIEDAFNNLPQDMVDRAIDSYERRLRRCIEVQGRSVEQEYSA